MTDLPTRARAMANDEPNSQTANMLMLCADRIDALEMKIIFWEAADRVQVKRLKAAKEIISLAEDTMEDAFYTGTEPEYPAERLLFRAINTWRACCEGSEKWA